MTETVETAETARHEQACPVCRRDDGLWVAKDGRWQVWHPTRLYPCGVRPAEQEPFPEPEDLASRPSQ